VSCEEIREDLEAYALGALEALEARRVMQHLRECAECSAIAESYRTAVDFIAVSVPLYRASPRLKERILGGAGGLRVPAYVSVLANRWVAGAAAAVLFAVAAGALAWAAMMSARVEQLQKDNQALAALTELDVEQRTALLKLQGDLNSARTEQRTMSRTLEEQATLIVIALDPELVPTALEGTALAPQAKCNYVWSTKQTVGALTCKDLPMTAIAHTYELWATKGEKTFPAGTFQPRLDGSASILVKFPSDAPGPVANMWVTLEQQQAVPRSRPSNEVILQKAPDHQAAR
jgi:hypothetical protein